ncbi:hypothetical protein Raf01_90530 [Rugosimonospora africana]|uniref:Uncharacterized protein n=1 Tax=Rugosimonospora africana TaxID=556532 RepID=A0A8J3R263_9ACTN|nr:hypothetical protein Raf01_90530 [Rugosimonospora africana]
MVPATTNTLARKHEADDSEINRSSVTETCPAGCLDRGLNHGNSLLESAPPSMPPDPFPDRFRPSPTGKRDDAVTDRRRAMPHIRNLEMPCNSTLPHVPLTGADRSTCWP